MEFPFGRNTLKHKAREDMILERFKRNDEVFRNTMEGIFQKYSNLEDPGLDFCFETMTFKTRKGTVPIDSVEAECELEHLRNLVNAEQSLRVLDTSSDEQALSEQEVNTTSSTGQMDLSLRTRNISHSNPKENSDDNLGHGAETSQLSLNSVSGSQSCLWGDPFQPEEEDEDLEKTLNSNGSTLLEVYPRMLNQIGKAYRRQQVTEAADAVLRRYRYQRWQSSQAKRHNLSNSLSHTLNKTTKRSFVVQKLSNSDMTSDHKGVPSHQGSRNLKISPVKSIRNPSLASIRSSQELSPLKSIRNPSIGSSRSNRELSPLKSIRNPSLVSSTCFYSPKRVQVEEIPVPESRSYWTGSFLHSDNEPQHRPVKVIDLSTSPPSDMSSPRSPLPDLNKTYNVEPVTIPSSGVFTFDVCSQNRSVCNSLLNRGRSVAASPSQGCHSQQISSAFADRKRCRDPCSSTHFPQQAPAGSQYHGGRSPLKPRVFRLEHEEETSPPVFCSKRTVPVNCADSLEVYSSPYRNKQRVSTSPWSSHHSFSEHQENLAMAEGHQFSPRPKRQRSFSGHQFTSSSVSHMSSRQIDAEFRRLYHHFICQGTSSSCHTSSCHLCERQLEGVLQHPPVFSSNMSALALTPIQSRLKKRRRQFELEESLKQKRFRESCSPKRLSYPGPPLQPQYIGSAVANVGEDKRTWNRALLLQCPSPRFLQASGGIKKMLRSTPGRQIHSHSPWRGAAEARSSFRGQNQSGVSLLPSVSRRRLLYGLSSDDQTLSASMNPSPSLHY